MNIIDQIRQLQQYLNDLAKQVSALQRLELPAGLVDTLYALLAGRAGGQSLSGGTAANDDLTLQGTTHATRTSSYVLLQPNGGKVGIGAGVSAPVGTLEVGDTIGTLYVTSTGAGTGDFALIDVRNNTNDQIQYFCFGSGYTGNALGIAAARYGALLMAGASSSGLMIGTVPNKPVIFGVNSAEVMRLTAAAAKITGTMNVTGAVDLDSTLNVDGVATFQTNVIVDQIIKALDAAGIQLQDDGGNVALVVIDGGVVAVGGLTSAGASVLGVKAGTSTNDAAVGGVLYVDSATNANGTTVETDLGSYSVPANTLAVNNQHLEFEAWITITNNANTKTIKFKFGGTVVTLPSVSGGAGTLHVRGFVVRTGAATQDIFMSQTLTGAVTTNTETFTTAAETLSGAVTMKFTGQSNAASNDVKQEFYKVSWSDANV